MAKAFTGHGDNEGKKKPQAGCVKGDIRCIWLLCVIMHSLYPNAVIRSTQKQYVKLSTIEYNNQ